MVKSRSSNTSLSLRSHRPFPISNTQPTLPSISHVKNERAEVDGENVSGEGKGRNRHWNRPYNLQLTLSSTRSDLNRPELISPTSTSPSLSSAYPSPLPQDSSLPVTPSTPFASDPFSHPTCLPEPTRGRPSSLAHQARARTRKDKPIERGGVAASRSREGSTDRSGPEIILASPSTTSVHYLFPTLPSLTGTHLSVGTERSLVGVSRGNSLRSTRRLALSSKQNTFGEVQEVEQGRKHSHPVDAFSAPTRQQKRDLDLRKERLASEPLLAAHRDPSTIAAEMPPTLRRRPSMADIGGHGRQRRGVKSAREALEWEENVAPVVAGQGGPKHDPQTQSTMSDAELVHPKFAPSRLPSSSSIRSLSAQLNKSSISSPIPYNPPQAPRTSRNTRIPQPAQSALRSPRPAPPLPAPLPASPQLSMQHFGGSLSVQVGDLLPPSLPSFSNLEYPTNGAVEFRDPFPYARSLPVPQGYGTENVFPGGVTMSRGSTREGMGWDVGRLAMVRDIEKRRNGSLNSSATIHSRSPATQPEEAVSSPSLAARVRRSLSLRSMSEARQTRRRSQSVVARPPREWTHTQPPRLPLLRIPMELGLGDPGVDFGDRYGTPRKLSATAATGLPVPSPILGLDIGTTMARPRFPLHPDLNASDASLLASPSTVGLGFSPLDSPISLPESLMAEAVNLSEHEKRLNQSSRGERRRKTSFSTCGSSCLGHDTMVDSCVSAPNPSAADLTQTSPSLLRQHDASPAISSGVTSPNILTPSQAVLDTVTPVDNENETRLGNATRYDVGPRKPRLRYSKSFNSEASGKKARHRLSKSISFRGRNIVDPTTAPGALIHKHSHESIKEESQKLNGLSRSISMRFRSKPSAPLQHGDSLQADVSDPPHTAQTWSIRRKSSMIDRSSSIRWRPPTIYSMCLPGNALEAFPSPDRINQYRRRILDNLSNETVNAPHTVPQIHVTPESSPVPARIGSSVSTSISATALGGSSKSPSPFLTASTSIRGSFKTLTKSISRTFERPSPAVRQTDSALKAKISSPLEATRELEYQKQAAKARRTAFVASQSSQTIETTWTQPNQHNQYAGTTGSIVDDDRSWRESLLTQAVSLSIKSGLNELAQPLPTAHESRSETLSWSASVGRAFLRSSGRLTARSVSEGLTSLGRRSRIVSSGSKNLGDIVTTDSCMSVSVYSTATNDDIRNSRLDFSATKAPTYDQPTRANGFSMQKTSSNRTPPIHVSHWSPPPKNSKHRLFGKSHSPRSKSPPPPQTRNISEPLPTRLFVPLEPIPGTPTPQDPRNVIGTLQSSPVRAACSPARHRKGSMETPQSVRSIRSNASGDSPEGTGFRAPTPTSQTQSYAASISIRLSKPPNNRREIIDTRSARSTRTFGDVRTVGIPFTTCVADGEGPFAHGLPFDTGRGGSPVVDRLSSASGKNRSGSGRDERVQKVLEWRNEVGDDDMVYLEDRIVAHKTKEREMIKGIAKRESVGRG